MIYTITLSQQAEIDTHKDIALMFIKKSMFYSAKREIDLLIELSESRIKRCDKDGNN